jgi:hypothetical protein
VAPLQLNSRAGLTAGVLVLGALAAPAAQAAGPAVSVRVEGASKTLLAARSVTLSGASVPGNPECGPASAGAAIEQATKGRWDRGSFVTTLLGETHDYSENDFWAEWIDRGKGYKYGGGVCADQLGAGDQLLMLVDQPPYGEGSEAEVPLNLKGLPKHVIAGEPVTLRVMGTIVHSFDPGSGTTVPIAGATVSGGGRKAVSNRRGRVTLRFAESGTVKLKAAKAGDIPSAAKTLAVRAPRVSVQLDERP